MKRTGTIVLVFLSLLACQNQSDNRLNDKHGLDKAVLVNPDSSLTESGKFYYENTKIQFGKPISFESTENIAIPIILEQKYVDKGMPKHSYFNIAVIDTSNQVQKLLFKETVVIDNIQTFENQNNYNEIYDYDEDYRRDFSDDYNALIFFDLWKYKERKRGYKRFYVYNLEKDELRQLSLENTNVTDWHLFNNQSKILIKYQFDSDNNGFFDKKDDENMILVNPNDPIQYDELFDLEVLKKIKIQVAKEN